MRRSMLFIPGNTPNLLMNGDVLGADSIILDLEDAVSPAEKDSARILVRNALKSLHYKGCEIIIRINPVETDYWMKDLDEIIPLKPNMIMPPKVSGAQDVKTVSEYIAKLEEKCGFEKNTVKLIPLIETAMGVENAFQIASADERVAAMFLGVYTSVLTAISDLNIPLLLPVGVGVLLGIFFGAKGINWCMKPYEQQTYFAILGLIAGSVPPILLNAGFTPGVQTVVSLFTLAAGAAIAWWMGKLEN